MITDIEKKINILLVVYNVPGVYVPGVYVPEIYIAENTHEYGTQNWGSVST